ncbi:hypothetical protein RQP46_001396 [Phenoliferia psychrophenolica]
MRIPVAFAVQISLVAAYALPNLFRDAANDVDGAATLVGGSKDTATKSQKLYARATSSRKTSSPVATLTVAKGTVKPIVKPVVKPSSKTTSPAKTTAKPTSTVAKVIVKTVPKTTSPAKTPAKPTSIVKPVLKTTSPAKTTSTVAKVIVKTPAKPTSTVAKVTVKPVSVKPVPKTTSPAKAPAKPTLTVAKPKTTSTPKMITQHSTSSTKKPVPKPTTSLKPVPKPTTTLKPVPKPTTSIKPVPKPTTSIKPVPKPTTSIKPVPKPTTSIKANFLEALHLDPRSLNEGLNPRHLVFVVGEDCFQHHQPCEDPDAFFQYEVANTFFQYEGADLERRVFLDDSLSFRLGHQFGPSVEYNLLVVGFHAGEHPLVVNCHQLCDVIEHTLLHLHACRCFISQPRELLSERERLSRVLEQRTCIHLQLFARKRYLLIVELGQLGQPAVVPDSHPKRPPYRCILVFQPGANCGVRGPDWLQRWHLRLHLHSYGQNCIRGFNSNELNSYIVAPGGATLPITYTTGTSDATLIGACPSMQPFCTISITFPVTGTTVIDIAITETSTSITTTDGGVSTLIYDTAAGGGSRRKRSDILYGPVLGNVVRHDCSCVVERQLLLIGIRDPNHYQQRRFGLGHTPLELNARWPSSPNSSKIPTTILYDARGVPKAFGAETKDDAHADEDYNECKWFKLHLHPLAMQPPPYELEATTTTPGSSNAPAPLEGPTSFEVPPLPPNVTVEQAYSDFIKYLFDNTKAWFETNAPDGDAIWKKLHNTLKLVIAHPNSWSLHEQAALKRAITRSGVLRGASVENHVVFVTESEASVHFGILYSSNQQSEWLSPSSTFAVVDGGGSTVDICVYEVTQTRPKLHLREAKTSDCTQSGAIFVSRAAEAIIKQKLGNSKFNTPEFVAAMVEGFDTKTKIMFDSVDDNYLIKFGFDRDTDKAAGISRGRLTLTGAEVKRAFDPCVDKIIASLRDQISGMRVKSILLVGGFGESPYLQRRLRETFEKSGTRVVTADEPSKKAVAEGGALFFSHDNVVARGTRFEPYDEFHRQRGQRTVIITPRGTKYIVGGWTKIVANGAVIETNAVHRRNFAVDFKSSDSYIYSMDLMTYEGANGETVHDGWSKDANGMFYKGFVKCCSVKADLTNLAASLPWLINPGTQDRYKDLEFDICLLFGGTSLRAELRWKENGVEKSGPASVIPSSFF